MGYYLPDLIKGIDVDAEQRRLRGVKFADAAPAGCRAAGKTHEWRRSRPHRRIRWMTIWPKGSGRFRRETAPRPPRPLNECSPSHPDDERATYGLAVASALQGKPDQARELIYESDRGRAESPRRCGCASRSRRIFPGRIFISEECTM